ncbi:amino acid adenylation domain-containing protein [Streptomyces sp. NRRL S-31]|uniref:non-ribosomal peptide synthetase n=1 Tax=Streptomyces sp. NRRL S-31 TaxID=1463898 RepID=UPI002657331E|nr:amino acid adenylation domain-containing protein [Streptomyces sp. NRRL S-31]
MLHPPHAPVTGAPPNAPGAHAPAECVRPASFAQQRLWFLSQLPGANAAYNEPLAFELRGPLDPAVLGGCLDALTVRHETLRTRLVERGGRVLQCVDPPGAGFALAVDDLTGCPDPGACLAGLREEEAATAFDLAAGPLGRGRLITLGPDRHVLLLTFHHAVFDGQSMNVLLRELGLLYRRSLSPGGGDPLPPLAAQYADLAEAQLAAVGDGGLAGQEAYWREALEGVPPVLDLPSDRPRPPEQRHDGGRVEFGVDAATTTALRSLARAHGATLFVAVLTGWAILLSRLSGRTDIVVGTPVANRRGPLAAGQIGFLVNSLALRVDLSGSPTAAEALARVRAVVRQALRHQDLPFEKVVELVNPPRSAAHTPLFQTMLAWQPDRNGLLDLPGVQAEPLPLTHAPARFDLSLVAVESGDRVTGHLDFATSLYDRSTAVRWSGHLQHLLRDLALHPEREITALELMSADERLRLLTDWDATDRPARPDALPGPAADLRAGEAGAALPGPVSDAVAGAAAGALPGGSGAHADAAPSPQTFLAASGLVELFEAQVRRRPRQTAVVCRDGTLDYATLDRRANRLAHALTARAVGPGDVVGLHVTRSCALAVGILGILKAGAAYLPLDPAQPSVRLAGMVEDASCPVVLSDADEERRPGPWLSLTAVEAEGRTDARPPHGVGRTPDQLAYVIFTSGSTGRPKGVAVEHRSVLNLFANWQARMGSRPGDVGSAWSSIGFDASVHELLLPLTTGGALHIVPEDLRGDPEALMGWMREHAVVQAFLPPAYVKWIDEDPARRTSGLSLRTLLTGVESLTEAALHRLTRHLPGLAVCFGYGPTEATLYSTAYHRPRPLERPCPIGRPLDGTRMYLLDSRMRPVPPGVVGEVYLGGACLARGYLNRPDLTGERFLPDPFRPGERVYRTGDLARRLPDGQAHYVGRADDQVKLRGFRIEPAEVEAALSGLPGVREAVVVVDRDGTGEPRLVAGTARGDAVARSAQEWRAALARRLPDHMIPAVFVDLPALPLNRSGKVDRPALLEIARTRSSHQVNTASPRDGVEHTLYRIWREILVEPDIGIGDNFFDVGGTSLSAIKMAHAVGRAFGRSLPVSEIMLRPTIEALGALLREGGVRGGPGSVVEFRAGTAARVVCVHPAGGTAFCYLPLAKHLPEAVGLHGIQSPGIDPGEEPLPTVEAMARTYLRLLEPLGPGPLVLTGLSYGGLVAHEMGRLLALAGRTDISVVLLDTQATDDPAARAAITEVDMAEFRDKLVRFNGMYPGIEDSQVERYFRVYNHNRMTARDHVPGRSPARLVLAQAVPGGADTAEHARVRAFWRERCTGDFRVERVDCDHWDMLEGPQLPRVAAVIAAEIAHRGGPVAAAVAPAGPLPSRRA